MSAQMITLLRGALLLLGALFLTDTIPTGMDGGGQKVAATCAVVAAMLAAGDKTPQLVKDTAAEQLGLGPPGVAQGFVSTPGRENNALPNSQQAWITFAIKALIASLTALLA